MVRYEHYEKDVVKLLICLGRERVSQMVHENDSHNVSTSMRQDNKFSTLSDMTVYDIYTNESKRLVQQFYEDDFTFFGYPFL